MPANAHADDVVYMRRALELASKGTGFTRPNPMVGAVVVSEGMIIGEGYHQKAGTPHAEVHAINAVADRSLLRSSTLYVTLEPCSHHGKTPPCADLIVASGIPRVVAGTTDTSAKVAGKGFERLRSAGVEVVTGVEEEACRRINRRFFTWHEKHRPWIILKWAQSSDGFIDILRNPGDTAAPNWISGLTERVLVHRWRAEEDAILAGGTTVRTDNPGLDVRLWTGNNPVRVIVSRSGMIDPEAKVFSKTGQVILFTADKNVTLPATDIHLLTTDSIPVREVVDTLYTSGIQSVIVEGGAAILNAFINMQLWDEARIFHGARPFGAGISAPEIKGTVVSEHMFSDSTLRVLMPEMSDTMII